MVVSGKLWVDIMNIETDKKQGVEALQRVLGVTSAQTAVFGDYLNDLLMLEAGDWSFAMGNAHPDLKAAARHRAVERRARCAQGCGQAGCLTISLHGAR